MFFFQGRLGIVKHIYKGTLFVYDKDNPENNGYFCAKPELCEVIKETCSGNMVLSKSISFYFQFFGIPIIFVFFPLAV